MEQEYWQTHRLMPSIFPVTCHTDFVGQGTTFVAIPGYADNGVAYIPLAIEKGASAIVIEKDVLLNARVQELIAAHAIIVERVENARSALADLSAQAAGFPAQKLKIIGITGTKGKTTTAFLLEHCLRAAGYKTGLISSAGNRVSDSQFPAFLTTPQPDYLQQFLKLCVDEKVEYVVMEVAAQALTLHRVKGIQFDGVIFTNFSHEHLEFYATLDDYCAAKRRIFDMVHPDAPIIINVDDEQGIKIKKSIDSANVIGYGFTNNDSEYKGMYVAQSTHLLSMYMHVKAENIYCENSALFGHYNAYNMLAAASMAHSLGVGFACIVQAFATFSGVPGRLQSTDLPNGARAFIDYAHNPSSFEAVLSTLRHMTNHLIVIFGAGGGKDKLKRPIMGALAFAYADCVILTSDNPRLENVEFIMQDILAGIIAQDQEKIRVCYDREKAIYCAYELSKKGSIIALLGKGPDEHQIIGTIKHFFSEKNILKQLI